MRARASTVANSVTPPDPVTPNFSLQVAQSGNTFGSHENLVDVCRVVADDDDIGSSLNACHRRDSGDNGKICVAAKQSRHNDRATPKVDGLDLKPLAGE